MTWGSFVLGFLPRGFMSRASDSCLIHDYVRAIFFVLLLLLLLLCLWEFGPTCAEQRGF